MAAAPAAADQSSPAPAPAPGSKLRYPLRSATKIKDNAAEASGCGPSSTASAKSRVKPPITVRSSVNVLNVSVKDNNSAAAAASRPPRRFSVPSKLTVSPTPREVASSSPTSNGTATATPILPTPESVRNRAAVAVNKPTPKAAATGGNKKKFSVLSSVSYWLSQIKVSESAAKHGISLGFFKLALESGCQPMQRMREELKSYYLKHNVVYQLGEPAKDLLQSYGIVEDLEKLKVSEETNNNNSPAAVENGAELAKECRGNVVVAVSRGNPTTGRNLKPTSLNPESPKVREAVKKDGMRATAKTFPAAAAAKTARTLQNKNDVVVKAPDAAAADGGDKHKNKMALRRNKADAKTSLVRSSLRKSTAVEKADPAAPTPVAEASPQPEEIPAENKENQEHRLEETVAMEIQQQGVA